MTVLNSDTFIRANQVGFGTGSDGNTWTQRRGTMASGITSNEGTASGQTATWNYWTYGATTVQDCAIQTREIPEATSDLVGVVARWQSGTLHYYYADMRGGNTIEIGLFDGAFHTLASAAFAFVAGTAYQILLQAVGSQLKAVAWLDGTQQPGAFAVSIVDTTIAVAGGFGIGCQLGAAGTIQFDHFSASTPPTPPPTTAENYAGNHRSFLKVQ
jgi:hypothetical protein